MKPFLPRFNSLTSKFIALSIIILSFFAIYIYSEFAYTQHMKGEATRIDLAGSLRYRSFEMALLARKMVESKDRHTNKFFSKELKNKIDGFDEVSISLKNGSEKHGISPLYYEKALEALNSITNKWENRFKPVLLDIPDSPVNNQRLLINKYDLMIVEYVTEIDSFVNYLSEDYENDIRLHAIAKFLVLLFFSIISILVILFIKRGFVNPIIKLKEWTDKIEKKNFDVKVDIKNRDEIGDLAASFNSMSQRLKASFEALSEGENKLQAIIDNSNAAICVKDTEGRFILVNKWFENMFHIAGEDITGKDDYYIFPKETAHNLRVNDQKVLWLNAPMEFEETFPDENGMHTYISMKFPLQDQKGITYAVCGISTDITERKQMEQMLKENESRLLNAQRIAHLGSWDWDIVKNTLYWSDEIYRIFGLTLQESGVTYEAFLNSVHPDDRRFVKKSVDAALYDKKPYSINHRIVLPNAAERIVHEQAEVIFDETGRPIRMVGTVNDITDLKQAEELLKKYNRELEEKVKERTEDLSVAMVQAENANKAKSDFLANMSHELRSPLSAIIGFSEMLHDRLFGELNEKQEKFINYINSSSRHLIGLINDILDIAKVESGKMTLELNTFPLKSLLEGTLILFKERAMKHNLVLEMEIESDADIRIEADERKLKQIMFNLLSNAVKFTPEGGSIWVRARRTTLLDAVSITILNEDFNGDFIEISVSDTGVGIKKEDIPKLFKEFTQLEPSYISEYKGTGLGLALTKKMVELHGGRIWLESEFGNGSKFTFIIPLQAKTLSAEDNTSARQMPKNA
ncbi:MAG: PAS domain S-box protein [Nitrospirae bacterium]|nr:PAS domain S-box protein [Nitrospirota bacterium]